MRLVQLLLPDEKRDAVLSVLDERDIDYLLSPEDSEKEAAYIAYFPLPEEAVQEVLDAIRDTGLDPEEYTVTVDADSATTEHIDELREEYTQGTEEGIAYPELRQHAQTLSPTAPTFLAMTAASTIVATAGLLRNSAAAVAGAMVIAPFFGTALSVGTGIACDDRDLLRSGVAYQLGGIGLVAAAAAFMATAVREFALMPPGIEVTSITQVSIFLAPSLLSVGIALAAGVAGALGVATAVSVPLSGVAVAAAIIPSAAVAGIGIAWELPSVVAGALLQLAVNVFGVNGGALATLAALGYTPDRAKLVDPFRGLSDPATVGAVVLAGLLVVATVGAVAGTAQHLAYSQTVNEEVGDTLERPAYEDLKMQGVSAPYSGPLVSPAQPTVTVTLGRLSDREYERLPDRLERQIERATGRNVGVVVQFVDYET